MRKTVSKILVLFLLGITAVGAYGFAEPSFAEQEPRYGTDYENAIPVEFPTEKISFASKYDTGKKGIEITVPRYSDGSGKTQRCAVIAGASAVVITTESMKT